MSKVTEAVYGTDRPAQREQLRMNNVGKEAKGAANQLFKALADGKPSLVEHALERIERAGKEAGEWLKT